MKTLRAALDAQTRLRRASPASWLVDIFLLPRPLYRYHIVSVLIFPVLGSLCLPEAVRGGQSIYSTGSRDHEGRWSQHILDVLCLPAMMDNTPSLCRASWEHDSDKTMFSRSLSWLGLI